MDNIHKILRESSTGNVNNIFANDSECYELIDVVGTGSTATVYKAKVKSTGTLCAVKMIDLQSLPETDEENEIQKFISSEITTLNSISHPNIINIYTSFVDPTGNNKLWMVMPFAGRSAKHIIDKYCQNGFSEEATAFVIHGVVKGLAYLHEKQIIHRDVKGSNIFIEVNSGDVKVVLGDFGISANLVEDGQPITSRKTFAGSVCWMAPEIIEQTNGHKTSADIWSLGITMIEILMGKAPWQEFQPMKIVMKVMTNPAPRLDTKEDKKMYSRFSRDFVKKCLQKDPNERITAEKLLTHKFFTYPRSKLDKGKVFICNL